MQVPHLNELHEKLNNAGLTIVGVTIESKGDTEKWIKEKGVKYAYAYDDGGKLSRMCGIQGIPHAVLVDPTGTVVFDGHPASLTEEVLKKATTGSLAKPLWDLPKAFAKVRAAITKGDLASALREAKALSANPEAPKVVEAIQGMLSGSIAAAQTALKDGDYWTAQRELTRLSKMVKGLPEEEPVKEGLATIAKEPKAPKEIRASQELDKVLEAPVKNDKQKGELRVALEDFAKKNDGTFASKKARNRITELFAK